MPTPIKVARQCLTPEASHALDEAVSVARRRAHAQTTSLHAVSALLSLPSSALREACARARNSAYSNRLQFKALELCLTVSLDRVPSGQLADDPPVSNSLMAAIKRSQANQRRHPENFHLYQQISNQSSVTAVKVELQHLILSILDDPIVSRVFGEAGFRSSEIKLAVLRPLPQFLRYSRSRGPPLFLCNLTDNPPEPIRRNFSFPFPGFSGVPGGDENSRRIAEVLGRTKGRNPLLVGVCAYDALQSFMDTVQTTKDGAFPVGLAGLKAICIENEVSRFTIENSDKGSLDSRLCEVGRAAKQSLGPGLVVNYGDLKSFVAESASGDAASYVVAQLTSLVAVHRVWLVGAAVSYEMYLKFVSKFPIVEKDWDLQLLPITSLRPAMAESYPRSSLMESFVPFGGFFSAPSDLKSPAVGGVYQCLPRCHLCNEKCEQEVYALSKGGFSASVADHYQSSLPSWLQMTELVTNKELNAKTQDDGVVLSAKITGLQKKWDSICQRLHHNQPFPEANTYQVASKFPTVVGFQLVGDKTGNADNHSSSNASENEPKSNSLSSCLPTTALQKKCTSQQGFCSPMVSEAKNGSFVSKLGVRNSKVDDLNNFGTLGSSCSLSNSSVGDGSRTSPTSATSVTTNLGLGMFSVSGCKGPRKASNRNHIELPQDLSGCSSGNVDLANESIHYNPVQTSSCSGPDFCGQNEPRDMKMIFRALIERVAWQKEAISVISQTIARCQTRNEKRHGATPKGDIWFNFSGPDRFGKKKIALALAEVLYGSRENFIHVDLSSKDGTVHTKTIEDRQEMSSYDEKFRGKTAVDYIAVELHKKPLSVVFLENVDKADVLVQNSLSWAIQTGKFSDSHGREISINNTIFLTTSASTKGARNLLSGKKSSSYCEDRIVRAKGWPIQILIVQGLGNTTTRHKSIASVTMRSNVSDPISANKRKPIGGSEVLERQTSLEMAKCAHKASTRYLDLNLPAEENEVLDVDSRSSDNDSFPENSTNWLQDFLDHVDETVWFKPFDFDALAEKFLKEINHSFCSIFGPGSSLEINSKVMEQLLSAAYLSDRDRVVEEWVEQVLRMGFVEVHERLFKNLNVHYVVKVVAREDLPQALGFRLPARIIVN